MYDVKKLTDWKESVQKEIDDLIKLRSVELMEIIKSELKPDDKLCVGMGVASILNKRGKSYEYDLKTPDGLSEFTAELTCMQYTDYFEAAPNTESINR